MLSLNLSGQTSQGTDFWVASTYPFYSNDSFYLAIASEKPTTAYLEIPRSNYKDSVVLGYNEIKYMKIPANLRTSYYYYYSSSIKKVGDNAIHVTSKLPLRVYSFSDGKWYSCGASAVYPTSTQPPGGVYYPYKSRYYWSSSTSNNYKVFFFTVVGIDDSVEVSFSSNSSFLWNLPPGNKITLLKGQLLRIYTWIQGFDPTLQVSASQGKRIAVFTENFYDYAQTNCFQYDLMYEQILPENVLGSEFVLTPFLYHKKGYDFTLTATANSTTIKKDGVNIATLDKGEAYYGRIGGDTSVKITSDKPINCWEKNILDTCVGWSSTQFYSGPSIMTISTSEQLITDATVSVPVSSNFKQNYITIITTQVGTDSLWLDGVNLPKASFKKIINGDFYLFQDSIIGGNHRITCPYGFISYIYGRGIYGGYAYNASAGLQSLKRYLVTKTYLSCDTGRIVKLTSEGDPAKNFQWTFNGKTDTGLVAYFQVAKEGLYPVKLKYQLIRNNKWDSLIGYVTVKGDDILDFITEKNYRICKPNLEITLPNSQLFSYQWNTGNVTNKLNVSTDGTYMVTVTNTATGCTFKDTTVVNLFAQMTPEFTISMKERCPGIPIYMTNTSIVGTGDTIDTYQWYVDNLPDQKTKHDTVKYAWPGTYLLKLIMVSKKGCKDSVSHSINVSDNPFVVSGHNTYDSCFGRASYKFNSRSALTVGKITHYQWLFSDGDTSFKKQQALKDVKDSGLYWYRFVAYSDAGCRDTTPYRYFRVYSAPKPSFNIPDSSVCLAGNFFNVKNTTNTFNKTVKYEWIWGDGSGETYDEPGYKNYADTGKFNIHLVAAYTATGCSDTFKRKVQVLPNPVAKLVIDSSNYCLNKNYFALSDNSDAKGALVRYTTWKWGDGTQTINASPTKKVYTSAGTFKIKLYFSTGKGCLDSTQKNVVVYTSPIAKWDVLDSNICGSNNYFNISNKSTASASAKYLWNWGNAATSTVKNPGKISYSGYGTFNALLVVTDPLTGCLDSAKNNLTVLKGLQMYPKISDTLVCDTNHNFTFTDSTNYGNIKPWRQWIFSATDKDTNATTNRYFKNSGYHNISIIGGLIGTCSDTIKKTIHIKYNNNPLKISHTLQYPCVNGIVNLSANTTQGNSWTYAWDAGLSQTYTDKNPSGLQYNTAGKYLISLEIKDAEGCTYQALDSLDILPAPKISILKIVADTQCLNGNNFSFGSNILNATNPINYDWDLDEGKNANTAAVTNVKYNTIGNKNIYVALKDANGCIDTMRSTIYVNPSPKITITGDTVCLGQNATVMATTGPAGLAIQQIKWYVNNAPFSTGNTLNYPTNTLGTFTIFAIADATGGCSDTSTNNYILVNPRPIAKFGIDMKSAIGTGVPVAFLDSSIGASNWTWQPDIQQAFIYSNNQKYTYLYPTLGNVTARLIVGNTFGCFDTTSKPFQVTSEELAWLPNSFSPNDDGKNDIFKPEGLSAVSTYYFAIYDRWGEKLFETRNPNEGWDGKVFGSSVQMGAYVYYMNAVFLTGKRLVVRGNITLMR